MADYIEPIERLALMFRRLGGIGKKTAVRLAFDVLSMPEEDAAAFADAITAVKRDVRYCSICQNISMDNVCPICSSETRDSSVICVVEDPRAVTAIENVREYNGLYHVLHGLLSPMDGITPDKIRVKELLARIAQGGIEEVIMATNPTVEGDATAMYIAGLLKPMGIKVSRLAFGLPVGGILEYADEVTLYKALENRNSM